MIPQACACIHSWRPACHGRRPRRRTNRRPQPVAPRQGPRRQPTPATGTPPARLSSWRTCPKVKVRRNVPSVDGARTRCPSTTSVSDPSAAPTQSSMQSAPSAHRGDQASSPCGPRSRLPDGRRDHTVRSITASIPEPPSEHRRQQHARVRDHPLIVEHDPRCVRQTIHHTSDPLAQDPQPLARPVLPASGGHLNLSLGRHPAKDGGSRLTRSPSLNPPIGSVGSGEPGVEGWRWVLDQVRVPGRCVWGCANASEGAAVAAWRRPVIALGERDGTVVLGCVEPCCQAAGSARIRLSASR